MQNDILTLDFINENIRPCTPVEATFNGTMQEAILLDITGSKCCRTSGDETLLEYLQAIEAATDFVPTADDEAILSKVRPMLSYYILSRLYRSARTSVTKFGVTTKVDENSADIDDAECSRTANYFKSIADILLQNFFESFPQFAVRKDNLQYNLQSKTIGY